MSEKVNRMLRRMKCTRKERRLFFSFSNRLRGEIRTFYEWNPKMINFSLKQSMDEMIRIGWRNNKWN